ncbi:hypothetical protein SAMN04487911_10148 [Arenibacter nanhaiticus]|uniref:Uncharacterized protein n=1 Tax=Arenibacter nanhaiticus TaxID=558155 RepID=A0A1M6A2G6_9FLAO|nr:hypothetical protein [Arenibacter nanhaiticus]SHI30656.1 hypothetical protein SAMN04487911_10148 [Arenibacter nanhaiticus]
MLLNIKLKDVDFIFILFLLLVTQSNIQLKLVGIFLILILRINAIQKINFFGIFYLVLLLFHLSFGLITLLSTGIDYLASYILVFLFWSLSLIIYTQLAYFVKNNSLKKISLTLNVFFLICVFVIVLQYIFTAINLQSINPYSVSPAAGDKMMSIFSNSSVSMIIMSFFFLKYLFENKWFLGSISFICLIMATYMSGTVLFLGSIFLGIFFFSKIDIKYKLYFIIITFLFIATFSFISPANIDYAMGYINRIWNNGNDTPFKIKSFFQTFEYWTSSIRSFVFGAGGGNFSSRVAFITSGDYVGWFPDILSYISEEFKQYHLGIWTHDFNNPWDNRNNTANQPFSFYNQIIGEYGLIGVLIFICFYLGFILKKWPILTYSKFLLLALTGYFLLDYWFEYFSVIIIFELFLLIDIKHNTKNSYNE